MNLDKETIGSRMVWVAMGVLLFIVAASAVSTLIYFQIDYPTHIKIASDITFDALRHPSAFLQANCYPVWHVLTWLTMTLFGCDGRSAAIVVTSGCITGTWTCAAIYFSKKYSQDKDIARVACCCLMLATPIWFPFFNPNIILGQGSPNLLHNPTQLMVRAAAFPCFIWYAAIMDGIGKKTGPCLGAWRFVALSLLVLAASLSKPSFLQMFFPAMLVLAVFKLVQYRKAAIKPILVVVASFIPVVLLMALQAWLVFAVPQTGTSGVGIGIAVLKIWSSGTPNVFISILLAILFPLIVLLWGLTSRKISTVDVLAWIMWGVAAAQAALLIEKGRRMWHANFFWGYNLALFFLWFAAIDRFISLTKEYMGTTGGSRQKWWFVVAVAALSLHLVSGLCYLWRVLIYGMWW